MTQPSLFISHGAPDLAIARSPARSFLEMLGRDLGRPEAIVIASAHYETDGIAVRAPERWRTLHDFGNFDERLFDIRYEPAGARAVADEMLRLLKEAGLNPRRDEGDEIDHGAWVPLSLMFPDAGVPVAMVSIDPSRGAAWHDHIGRALRPLRDSNILVIGSGSISHNLRAVFSGAGDEELGRVEAFTSWLESAVRDGRTDDLLDAIGKGPAATWNHPSDEHLLPFYVAMGAGGADQGRRVHHSYTHGILAMDAYAFGEAA
jgi:4,5-DOPA dioxygenase extradiol